ncbi:uncharacterized protein CTRU02_204036 [Colletotrichum truncatum]|uniref:Uncharacterized protein n=1 Tax=Colletotrichum truncatum TaxID=5467 RepID=A0ACC3ZAY5_COLTU|nr:uncharacterized protein CTRU02_13629 [Colletotrichum truncatum]KAF6783162.1 hypothetical protein CTRU02_13629 [Colletotrichum truncatum]
MQTLAPIHLLPRRDAPLDHWRGGYWGMNNPAAYTPLESLFLFQALARYGVEAAAFAKVSDELIKNSLIKEGKTYDAARLSPEALRQLFLHIWTEELRSDTATSDKPDGSSSPTSKKRKLSRAPLPTLKEAKEQAHKYPALVQRLYARYKDLAVKEIRDDEQRIEALGKEIKELEAQELADKAKAAAQRPPPLPPVAAAAAAAAAANGTPTPKVTPTPVPVPSPIPNSSQTSAAPPQIKPPTPTPAVETPRQIRPAPGQGTAPTQTPVPVPTPVPLPPQAQIKPPPASTTVPPPAPQPIPPKRDVVPPAGAFQQSPVAPPVAQAASAAAGTPASTPATAPAAKQHQPLKPPNAGGQVLQPPVGAGQPPVRPGQSTSPVPLPAISPRPENVPKSRTPGPATPAQPATPGTLKWEKPYQPTVPATQPQGRPVPPQIPTTSAPSTPGQPHHPSQWYPQPAGQYHGPPHSPHVPIQPNQTPRYPQQSQPVLVPPQGQPQPQSQPQAQARPQGQVQSQAQPYTQTQPKGQLVAPIHSTPVKGPSEVSAIQPPQGRPVSTTPIAPPVRPQPAQHQQQAHQPAAHPPHPSQPPHPPQPPTGYQPPHQRPLAAASPVPASGPSGQTTVPPPRWPQSQPSPYTQQQFSPTPAPAQPPAKAVDSQRRVTSPFIKQQPHPAIPAHLVPQLATPTPAQRSASTPIPPPQTPVTALPTFHVTGSGTKWNLKSTPSTPRQSEREVQSPAFEPLSPVQQQLPLPASTPSQPTKKASPKPVPKPETKTPRGRGRPPRSANKIRSESTPSSVVGMSRRSQSVVSQTDELSMDHHDLAPRVKDENATPRATPRATPKPHDETGDTTADESVPSRRNMITPSSVSSRLAHKRKRQDTPAELPPIPATHVLWTRQFGRVSAAALDQIGAHRFANQFANPIRERDAPGYKTLILQPQDIKSIRAAITHGNRAATEAAKALPDGDPGTGSVLLPISDDLVPPKSIINSAQLERELFHMFSNAVMYNLNPSRGPGPSFMKNGISEGADALGYEVDEDAVVRSTRMMAGEVEKIIGELRNAEKERTGQAPSTSGNTRPASVATGEDTPMAEDDVDELAGDADMGSTTRRRRVGTRN